MMTPNHIIKKQILEFKLDSKNGSFSFQNRMSRFYRTEILPIIEAYFAQVGGDTEIVRIDKLEIDLGVIPENNFRTVFKTKFNEVFPEKLFKVVAQYEGLNRSGILSQAVSPYTQSGITKEARDFEMLEFFLREGRLPWWVGADESYDLPALIEQFATVEPGKLIKLLSIIAGQPALVKRLVYHASDGVLEKLSALFQPQEYQKIIKLSRDLFVLFSECPLLASAGALKLRMEIWAGIFSCCLVDEGGGFINGLKIAETVIDGIARNSGVNGKELHGYVLKNIKKSRFGKARVSVLPELEVENSDYRRQIQSIVKLLVELEVDLSRDETARCLRLTGVRSLNGFKKLLSRQIKIFQKSIGKINQLSSIKGTTSIFAKMSLATDKAFRKATLKLETAIAELRLELNDFLDQKLPGEALAAAEKVVNCIASLDEFRKEPSLLPELTETAFFSATEEIYIHNAGLVILWPYLTSFLETIGLVEHNRFINEWANERGVLLLQYLACGAETVREYDLPLNKILCGLSPATPVGPCFEITAKGKKEVENLLQAVIRNWPALKNISPSGLRELFLQREGMIFTRDGQRVLRVTEQACDILMDQMPWGIGTVKLPWMEEILLVEWRM